MKTGSKATRLAPRPPPSPGFAAATRMTRTNNLPSHDDVSKLMGTPPKGDLGLNDDGSIADPTQIPAAPPPAKNAFILPVKALDYFQRGLRINAKSAADTDGTTSYALEALRRHPAKANPRSLIWSGDFFVSAVNHTRLRDRKIKSRCYLGCYLGEFLESDFFG